MAVPKKKRPRAATRTRRATWTAEWPQLTNVKNQYGSSVVVPSYLRKAVKMGLYEPKNTFED